MFFILFRVAGWEMECVRKHTDGNKNESIVVM